MDNNVVEFKKYASHSEEAPHSSDAAINAQIAAASKCYRRNLLYVNIAFYTGFIGSAGVLLTGFLFIRLFGYAFPATMAIMAITTWCTVQFRYPVATGLMMKSNLCLALAPVIFILTVFLGLTPLGLVPMILGIFLLYKAESLYERIETAMNDYYRNQLPHG